MPTHVIRLFRPHQYIKNFFVFAPLFFSFDYNLVSFYYVLVAFVLFSLIASSIYAVNDLLDIEEDRAHPIKKHRPLASGVVKPATAKRSVVGLASVVFIVSFIFSPPLFIVLLAYFLLNIAYSIKLKHITLVDIFIIATGFVLRLFAGAIVIHASLSMWIVTMTFLLALFLAIAKRRDDVLLSGQGKETRKNIDGYNLEFVNAIMVLMAGVLVMAYILYTVSEDVITRLGSSNLYITAVFVVLGVMRYMQITFVEQNSGSPSKLFLQDRFLQITLVLWLTSFYVIAVWL